jgi:hypothetical protein
LVRPSRACHVDQGRDAEASLGGLYLDDELVDQASWENGKLADQGEDAEASLKFFLPWIQHFEVKLVTEDWDGRTEESSVCIGCAPPKPK